MTNDNRVRKLDVLRRLETGVEVLVGSLAQNATGVYFQYDSSYLANFHSLSPFKLAFNSQLHQAPAEPHLGLHGVFADSLPDGWGTLLMDRVFRQRGIAPHEITAMDRLAYIGDRGMGALRYHPSLELDGEGDQHWLEIETLGKDAQAIYDGETDLVLAELARAGGSGGARPKAQIYIDPHSSDRASTQEQTGLEPWLVKFTSRNLPLGHEESLCEAAYLQMAANAGIDVPEWKLITPKTKDAIAWLALRRFDCSPSGRYHMHSACGLMDASFRLPSMDYLDLIKVTQKLCKSVAAGQEVFARGLFNVFGLNQDDHTKNWAYLMDDVGNWRLSPFYDVTFSPNTNNEHMMAFQGYGKTPPLVAIQQLAKAANYASWDEAKKVAEKILDAFSDWQSIATDLGVKASTRKLIGNQLGAQQTIVRALYQLK
jgi:serine/threonine-protein kinase HipA